MQTQNNETEQLVGFFLQAMFLSAFSVSSQGILSLLEPILGDPKQTSRPTLSCGGEGYCHS